jgi:single-stranded-DNA-specific exonuclease
LSEAADVLVRFGGHQQAAGLEMLESRLDELRERFVAAVQGQSPGPVPPGDGDLLLIEPGDDPGAVLADLDRLEPCGFGNPRPRVQAHGAVVEAREVRNGHLKLVLDLGTRRLSCFAIHKGAEAASLRGRVRVVGDLRHNVFPGSDSVELFAEQVHLERESRDEVVEAGGAGVLCTLDGWS